MKRIKYIGLDMDHTLVRYNTENFESLAHKTMLEKLVNTKSYPESVLNLKFDYARAVRGLVIDKARGNILKLSRHAAIRSSYHGLEPISFQKQNKLYASTYIDLKDPEFDTVDTTFSLAIATLFAQLVELKDTSETRTLPDYAAIAVDLNAVLDEAHQDDSLKGVVRDNLKDFIVKDPEVVAGLERFKKHGKKIFVLTNSDYTYSKILLDYAINPFLKDCDHWSDLFEYVVTSAQKPRFFYDKLSFLKVDPETGSMTNSGKELPPGIYQGGCASTFTKRLNLVPDDILYVGDHIYGDVVRLKKDCAWRTALIIEELAEEVDKSELAHSVDIKINALMEKKVPLEIEIDQLISERIEKGESSENKAINELIEKSRDIDKKIGPLIKERQGFFNPYWGEVMRAGIEESFFAYQVERYACIYMPLLKDFLDRSPRTYYRSARRPMPHES